MKDVYDPYPQLRQSINESLLQLNEKIRQFDSAIPTQGAQDRLRHEVQELIGGLWESTRSLKLNLNNIDTIRKLSLPIEEIQNRHGFVDDAKDRLLHAEKVFFRALRERESFQKLNLEGDKQGGEIHGNDFVATEIGRQTAILIKHDQDVSSIRSSVNRVRSTAEHISGALGDDESERSTLDGLIENLSTRFHTINDHVNRLLAETSQTSKLSLIAVLVFLLVALVILTFIL